MASPAKRDRSIDEDVQKIVNFASRAWDDGYRAGFGKHPVSRRDDYLKPLRARIEGALRAERAGTP